MAKIIKAVDWIAENLNIYEQINRTDVSQNSVEHRWNPLGIQQEGTNINAEFLNAIQKNGVYGILETSHTVVNNEDRYIITNFDGIEGIGVFKDLKIKVQINENNIWDNPKLVINNIEYSMICLTETASSNIKKNQLEENKIYSLIFNGVDFVVENSSLRATETNSGLTSLNDVRTIVSEVTGAKYNGKLGSDLKEIKKDNSYLYNNNIYVAKRNFSNTNGFLVPDTTNFDYVSNVNLLMKSSNTSQNGGSVNLGDITFFWGFIDCYATDTKGTALATPTGYSLLQVFTRVGANASITGTNYEGNTFYTQVYNLTGARISAPVTYLLIAKKI